MGCGCTGSGASNCNQERSTLTIYRNRAVTQYNRTVDSVKKQEYKDILDNINSDLENGVCPSQNILDIYKNSLY